MNAQSQFEIAQEPEQPPTPPGSGGRISLLGEVNDISIAEFASSSETRRWPDVNASERRVILVPLSSTGSFLAFGLSHSLEQPLNVYSAPFVARGSMSDHLWNFLVQMQKDGARVEFFAEAPVERLQQYVTHNAALLSESVAPASLVTSLWEESNNEAAITAEHYTRSAA